MFFFAPPGVCYLMCFFAAPFGAGVFVDFANEFIGLLNAGSPPKNFAVLEENQRGHALNVVLVGQVFMGFDIDFNYVGFVANACFNIVDDWTLCSAVSTPCCEEVHKSGLAALYCSFEIFHVVSFMG